MWLEDGELKISHFGFLSLCLQRKEIDQNISITLFLYGKVLGDSSIIFLFVIFHCNK